MKPILTLLILCRVAVAQVSPVIVTDQTLTGKGSTSSPMGVRVATGGGLSTDGGVGGLRLITTCTSGQVLQWSGSAWACSSTVTGTVTHLAMFTPDGSHVGDSPMTYDGSVFLTPKPLYVHVANVANNLDAVNTGTLFVGQWSGGGTRASGTADVTTIDATATGGNFVANATIGAGTHALNNFAVIATATGGTHTIAYVANASGGSSDNYSFYGDDGSFLNGGPGFFLQTLDVTGAATADAGRRIFDIAGTGLTSSANTVSLSINGGSTQTCGAGSAVTSVTSAGIATCSAFGSGSGTVTSVATGTGLTGGTITTTGTLSLANTAVTPGSYTYGSFTVDQQGRLTAASSGTAPLTASNLAGTTNHLLKITGANTAGDSNVIDDGTTTTVGSSLFAITDASGNLAINTSKFTVAASTGNTQVAGTLNSNGGLSTGSTLIVASTAFLRGQIEFADNTNAAFTGQLNMAGFAGGTTQFRSLQVGDGKGVQVALFDGTNHVVDVGAGTDTPGAASTSLIVQNAGTTCSEVRDATNDVEAEHCASSSGTFFGSFTNHSTFLQTNGTNALKINTSQRVEALADFIADGNTTIGAANTNTLTVTAKINSHLYYNGTAPTYSCAGATVDTGSTDERGRIVTPDTSCTLTFAIAYTTNAPFCTANASSNIAVGVTTTLTTAVFTMASKPTSMSWACDGGL